MPDLIACGKLTLLTFPSLFCQSIFEKHFRWTDLHSWPWGISLWLAFFLAGWLKSLWRWLQREQAKSWPTTSAHIDSATVAKPKGVFGLPIQLGDRRPFDALLAYSYKLSGNIFHGEYRQKCNFQQEAHEFLRGLEGQTITVQYNSNRPARSVLLETTVETMLLNRPQTATPTDAWHDNIPAWLKPLISICAALAFIGLLVSIVIQITVLTGRQIAPDYVMYLLHAGLFVVFFPALFIAQNRVGQPFGKDFWKRVTAGSPDGVRYLLYILFAYVFVEGMITFFQEFPDLTSGHQPPLFAWRRCSGVWMVFYYASFAVLTSAHRSLRHRQ